VPAIDVGTRVELSVGAVAHGGHCLARASDGRVVFVRHALPGERVRAEVTEERSGYLRADAVEILDASPDRVVPPCPFAGPDRCGGCDFQHASPSAQRELKAAVVVEQLTRLARLTSHEIEALSVRVEPLPGGVLGWRSRLRYSVDGAGRVGLLKHRSHEVVPVDQCRIAAPSIAALPTIAEAWPDADAIEVVASSGGDIVVTAVTGRSARRTRGDATMSARSERASPAVANKTIAVTEVVRGRRYRLDPAVFWQVHPAAPEAFVAAVLEYLAVRPGERAWDLYGGAGLFAAALADAVGPDGAVTLVESDPRAVRAASEALADLHQVTVVRSTVERARLTDQPDLVVLDPPRAGAGTRVVKALVAAAPRAIAYVACDPAALARDVATFRASGWGLAALRAFDAFPMTHHVECVALLKPPGTGPGGGAE
jgi:tRNA/tmRNA/rRNA uracil-C5-methylase (TrmA/RlmC/RlmD family)